MRRLGAAGIGERWLWHGTEREKVAPILANGFLRDYNKRGAYGCGVYFASQASYSLSSTYARPDDASGDPSDDPSDVARLIRCVSPPESVIASRSSVR